jgi:hypothetical protein
MRQEFGAIPGAFFDSILLLVKRLTQPPLSVAPGTGTTGSYLAEQP